MKPAGQNPIRLRCFSCEREHDAGVLQSVCTACGDPLRVDYDLPSIRLTRRDVCNRVPSLWRYREVLPLPPAARSRSPKASRRCSQSTSARGSRTKRAIPTGSFKARGMTVAVSMARRSARARSRRRRPATPPARWPPMAPRARLAGHRSPCPTTRRARSSTSARHYGADVQLRAGHDRRRRQVAARARACATRSTSRRCEEPYRIEGKKTMAYELVEQLDGELPDVIVYPTGGGTGLVGMWKAFDEMQALGWIERGRRPRLVSRAGRRLRARRQGVSARRCAHRALAERQPRARRDCACRRRSADSCACARFARQEVLQSRLEKQKWKPQRVNLPRSRASIYVRKVDPRGPRWGNCVRAAGFALPKPSWFSTPAPA